MNLRNTPPTTAAQLARTTLSKYLSIVSTSAWMNSRMPSSFYKTAKATILAYCPPLSRPSLTHLRVVVLDADDEKERRVSSVDDLVAAVLHERALKPSMRLVF
jgi:hypothetical protein